MLGFQSGSYYTESDADPLHRLLTKWRHPNREEEIKVEVPAEESRAIDPATGWQISPIVAGALCMKPSKTLTPPPAVKVAALKEASRVSSL